MPIPYARSKIFQLATNIFDHLQYFLLEWRFSISVKQKHYFEFLKQNNEAKNHSICPNWTTRCQKLKTERCTRF